MRRLNGMTNLRGPLNKMVMAVAMATVTDTEDMMSALMIVTLLRIIGMQ